MKKVNTKAIVKYLRSTLGSLPDLKDVSWRCQNGSLKCEHNDSWCAETHGDARKFVYDLI